MQGNMPSKSMGVGKNQLSDSAQLLSSTHDGSSVIRPSSNYNSRSQQLIGPQKGTNLLYITFILDTVEC